MALVAALASLASAGASGPRPASSAPRRPSVRDSPGYVPAVDPESASVALGRRTNAPLVTKPFEGGASSLEDLGRRVCRALRRQEPDSLLTLCVREDEFRDILWPEFPQSRPATGLRYTDAWPILAARIGSGCRGAVIDNDGHFLDFVSIRADSVARYRNFTLRSGVTIVARDDEGQAQSIRWLRAVVERGGRFKIYSTSD